MSNPASMTIKAPTCTPSLKSGSRKNAMMNQTIPQRYFRAARSRSAEILQFPKGAA